MTISSSQGTLGVTVASRRRLKDSTSSSETTSPGTQAAEGAEQRDQHRLEGDHPAYPVVGHADDAQQAQLAAAFEDRERHRVDDADQGDDDAHQQQAGDRLDQEVEDVPDQLAEGVALLGGDVGAQVGEVLDRVLGLALGAGGDVDEGDGGRDVADRASKVVLSTIAAGLRGVLAGARGRPRPGGRRPCRDCP